MKHYPIEDINSVLLLTTSIQERVEKLITVANKRLLEVVATLHGLDDLTLKLRKYEP